MFRSQKQDGEHKGLKDPFETDNDYIIFSHWVRSTMVPAFPSVMILTRHFCYEYTAEACEAPISTVLTTHMNKPYYFRREASKLLNFCFSLIRKA